MVPTGHQFRNDSDLMTSLVRSCSNPKYMYADARQRQVQDLLPVPADAMLYRGDGAARGQGTSDVHVAEYGCICYASQNGPRAWKHVHLGDQDTNNIAEYNSLLCILLRIGRHPCLQIIVELDSLLVCRQVLGEWRCRSTLLRLYFDRCWDLLSRARSSGKLIQIRHIYKEHNYDADALANLGTDGLSDALNW